MLATGDVLTAGDTFDLIDASDFAGSYTAYNLPALAPGLAWDTAPLLVDGTIRVITASTTSAGRALLIS